MNSIQYQVYVGISGRSKLLELQMTWERAEGCKSSTRAIDVGDMSKQGGDFPVAAGISSRNIVSDWN